MATPNYKPLLNSSENLKALLADQNSQGITSAVFSGNEPVDVLSAKTIFNAAKSAEDIAGVSSITAGTGISVSGATGAVTISSTVTGTLPTQTGNSGKLLTTDGTNSSWTTTPVATSLTGPTATALTLTGGSSGASLVLGSGANGAVTITPKGTGYVLTPNGYYHSTATALSGGYGLNASGGSYLGIQSALISPSKSAIALGYTGTVMGAITPIAYFVESGNVLIGTTTDMASTTGGLTVAATGSGATATAVNTGGLRSANFGLSTVSGGASYFGGVLRSRLDQNAGTELIVQNSTSGTGAYSALSAYDGTYTTQLGTLNTGYTTSGPFVANTGFLTSNAPSGFRLISQAGEMRFYSSNTLALTLAASTQAATFAGAVTANGNLTVGNSNLNQLLTIQSATAGPGQGAALVLKNNTTTMGYFGRSSYISSGAVNTDAPALGATTGLGLNFFVNDTTNALALASTGAATFAGAVTHTLGTDYPPQTAPASPASGWVLYTDSGDGNKLKAKASTGTVVTIGTP